MVIPTLVKKKLNQAYFNQLCYHEIQFMTTYKKELLVDDETIETKYTVVLCDGFILAFEQLILTHYYYTQNRHLFREFSLHHNLQKLLNLSQLFKSHEVKKTKWLILTTINQPLTQLISLINKKKNTSLLNTSKCNPFKQLDTLINLLQQAIKEPDAFSDNLASFNASLSTLTKLHLWQTWFIRYAPLCPKKISPHAKKRIEGLTPTIFNTLYFDYGWDNTAITTFFVYLYSQVSLDSQQSVDTLIFKLLLHDTQLIGSRLYTKMFQRSRLTTPEKTELVLKQLGAELDSFNFLQLRGTHRLDPKMSPHSEFIELYCYCVRDTYKDQELSSPKIHQLRMYFDRQNINYIRKKFPRQTDEASLEAYRKAPAPLGLGQKKLLREPARFHNKYPKDCQYDSYQASYLQRKRLTPNFHSEFILNQQGKFVSQWNVLKQLSPKEIISNPQFYEFTDDFKREILNGESLNYGTKNNQEHRRLDSDPPIKYDHLIRKLCKTGWRSPSLSDYDFNKIDKK